jgi:type I restriction enzyme, S subunit
MTAEALVEHAVALAESSGSVATLRALAVDLATAGMLTVPSEADGSGAALLQQLASQRQRLVEAGKIRQRSGGPLATDERLFHAPANWAWGRLSDVGHELGQTVPAETFTYIDVGGIDAAWGVISNRVEVVAPQDAPSRARKLVRRGTVIYSTVRPYLLNVAIVEREYDPPPIASTAFGILHPFDGVDRRYLFYWLRSRHFTAYVQAGMKGMAYPAINDEKFYSGPIALPPLAEQKRIVAKVDELMGLCDRLEAQQQQREHAHAALTHAALARFADAPTAENLEYLFHTNYSVDPASLRQALLMLAFRGGLCAQVPEDGDARDALELMILEAKRTSTRRDRIARADRESDVIAPHPIPASWTWTTLGTIGSWGSGSTPPRENQDLYGGGMTWLKSGELNDNQALRGSSETVSESAIEQGSFRQNQPGDVLFAMYGATVGKVAILAEPAVTNQAVCGCTPCSGVLNTFLFYYLVSERESFRSASAGAAQPNFSKDKILTYPFPLPPLAEQRRIVAKVNDLTALVDRLEADLAAARDTGEKLMDAVVAELCSK